MRDADRTRAVVQVAPRRFEIHDFERPRAGRDDAVLRLELCGICGSDVEQYDGHFDSIGLTSGPTVPGHEPLGIIEEIGDLASRRWNVGVGDRVAVEPLIPCASCEGASPATGRSARGGGECSATGSWGSRATTACSADMPSA